MKPRNKPVPSMNIAKGSALLLAALMASTLLSGCVAVGYSSGGGWFIWPGGLGLLLIIVVLALVLRRR